jgi:hypothetical protein
MVAITAMRGEIIEKSINVEWILHAIISQHYFGQAFLSLGHTFVHRSLFPREFFIGITMTLRAGRSLHDSDCRSALGFDMKITGSAEWPSPAATSRSTTCPVTYMPSVSSGSARYAS